MTFLIIAALMTAIALVAIVWPFAIGGQPVPNGSDIAVYKDQLAEIDRDLQAASIGTSEARTARLEVSRRMLQAADDAARPAPLVAGNRRTPRLTTLAVAIILLPVLAGSLYLHLRSPGTAPAVRAADQSRLNRDDDAVDAMVSEVEGYLKEAPGDGKGWEALAPIYMRVGRYDDAIRAWRKSIANLGDSAEREENLGESLVAAADGIVTKEATAAFDKARSIDPTSVPARFYAGLAASQDGRRDEAARIWRAMIATAPPDAEWVDTVRGTLAQLDHPSASATDGVPTGGDQHVAMIGTMVEQLAERLEREGGDPDRWYMLIRSYETLGDHEKAMAATARARLAFVGSPEQLDYLNGLLGDAEGPSNKSAAAAVAKPATKDTVLADASASDEQLTMIKGMVDRLADRLKKDGHDVGGWARLVRSYIVLGQRERAIAAINSARVALADDADALRQFDAAANELDIGAH